MSDAQARIASADQATAMCRPSAAHEKKKAGADRRKSICPGSGRRMAVAYANSRFRAK